MYADETGGALISLSEMAGWFGISLAEAVDIIAQGHIPCAWVNGEVHVGERALNGWIEQQFNFPVGVYPYGKEL